MKAVTTRAAVEGARRLIGNPQLMDPGEEPAPGVAGRTSCCSKSASVSPCEFRVSWRGHCALLPFSWGAGEALETSLGCWQCS